MKLYTEEQVKKIYEMGVFDGQIGLKHDILNINTMFMPIELPSDDEIEKAQKEQHLTMEEMCRFEEGVEWVIKQINNQNK